MSAATDVTHLDEIRRPATPRSAMRAKCAGAPSRIRGDET